MAYNQDYIPARDSDFDGWLTNLTNYLDSKTAGPGALWTHIPPEKLASLKAHAGAWRAAYAKTVGPHNSVETEAKNDIRASAKTFIRQFVAQYLKFDPVTNEDRTAMNLHNRDTTHSSIGRPESRALITDLRSLGGFRTEIRFQDEAAPGSQAIPYGMNGCLLNYLPAEEKVQDYGRLLHSVLMTRSPFTLALGPNTEGQFLSCAARWQNKKGELGPWGEIQHIVIT
ncbi:MAG: hypothetical protein LBG90_08310 [Spirochaetaceae bacterium]|jgi:hypothetical protein|nr:hypothetical protein [Spirochaetaceae bacterium]